MQLISPAEHAARRLIADARTFGDLARDAVATAACVVEDLAHALARWFGPYGTHALLTRALTQARRDHPVLAAVRLGAPLAPVLDGVDDAARAHGAAAVTEGVTALLAAAIGLLGRMTGEDMALHLVERRMEDLTSAAPDPDRPTTTDVPTAGGAA